MLAAKLLAASAMGAIEYVGGVTYYTTTATENPINISLTALTGGSSSAPAVGDLVVVAYGGKAVSDVAMSFATAGYTVDAELYSNSTADANFLLGHKLMGVTPDTSVSMNGLTYGQTVAVMVFRGVNPSAPVETASTATGTGFLPNPPSVTPSVSGSIVLLTGVGARYTSTKPADGSKNYACSTSTQEIGTSGTYSSSSASSILMGYVDGWISGSIDPAGFTSVVVTDGSDSWAAVSLVIKPT